MKAKLSRKQPLRLCLWRAVLGMALPVLAQAQDPFPTPTPPPDPLAGVPVQVLDQQQVTIGTHIITFNRITPPAFPAATPPRTPAPQATPITKTTNSAPQTQVRKAARSTQNEATGDGEKQYKALMLSATVYDHQFTELRRFGAVDPTLRAYVNIDFAYFTTVTTIETTDTVYSVFFAWSNDTADSLTQAGQTPPNLAAFPADRSSYQVIAGDSNADPDAIAILNVLCAYYDAHSTQMISAYNQREADNAARQQWLAEHPPVQPNTTINYWPVKNSVFLQPKH